MENGTIAILGILFIVTAIIAGSVVSTIITNNRIGTEIGIITERIESNTVKMIEMNEKIEKLKATTINIDNTEVEKLIDSLQDDINDLLEDNEDLEDDLDSLRDKLKDIYALLPQSGY